MENDEPSSEAVVLHIQLQSSHPLANRAAALGLWRALQDNLGHDVRGALLLPDELHVLLTTTSHSPRRRVAGVCAALRRRQPGRWAVHGEPRQVPRTAPVQLAAVVVERGLVSHPLQWEFSTWRDAAGLVCCPWVDPADLSVRPLAVEPVEPARHRRVEFARVIEAVCAATRLRPDALAASPIGRRMLLQVSAHQGWDHPELLARVLQLRIPTVRRALRAPLTDEGLAVLRCLRVPACTTDEKPHSNWGILGACSLAS